MPTTTPTRTVPARQTIELRLTRAGAKLTLAAVKSQVEKLEAQGGIASTIERLRMVAWEIECQLGEVREVEVQS